MRCRLDLQSNLRRIDNFTLKLFHLEAWRTSSVFSGNVCGCVLQGLVYFSLHRRLELMFVIAFCEWSLVFIFVKLISFKPEILILIDISVCVCVCEMLCLPTILGLQQTSTSSADNGHLIFLSSVNVKKYLPCLDYALSLNSVSCVCFHLIILKAQGWEVLLSSSMSSWGNRPLLIQFCSKSHI